MLELIQFLVGSKASHYAKSKMIVGIQEVISPYSLKQNSTFKHSLDVEIDLEAKGSKRLKNCGV